MEMPTAPGKVRGSAPDTRTAVAQLMLENGPQTAAALGERLGLSAAAVRRHLDALVGDGLLLEREPARVGGAERGRGRPARSYALTDAGRAAFPHAYDDLASTALRYLRVTGGDEAVMAFARHRAAALEERVTAGQSAPLTLERLALALTTEGYPADVRVPGPTGAQLCQHHCPVAHVATEFPQLCVAETQMFERVLGTYVQRLATIGHGDGVCTTHVPQHGSTTSETSTTATRTTATRTTAAPRTIGTDISRPSGTTAESRTAYGSNERTS